MTQAREALEQRAREDEQRAREKIIRVAVEQVVRCARWEGDKRAAGIMILNRVIFGAENPERAFSALLEVWPADSPSERSLVEPRNDG